MKPDNGANTPFRDRMGCFTKPSPSTNCGEQRVKDHDSNEDTVHIRDAARATQSPRQGLALPEEGLRRGDSPRDELCQPSREASQEHRRESDEQRSQGDHEHPPSQISEAHHPTSQGGRLFTSGLSAEVESGWDGKSDQEEERMPLQRNTHPSMSKGKQRRQESPSGDIDWSDHCEADAFAEEMLGMLDTQ
jgi:hypothetical protein